MGASTNWEGWLRRGWGGKGTRSRQGASWGWGVGFGGRGRWHGVGQVLVAPRVVAAVADQGFGVAGKLGFGLGCGKGCKWHGANWVLVAPRVDVAVADQGFKVRGWGWVAGEVGGGVQGVAKGASG